MADAKPPVPPKKPAQPEWHDAADHPRVAKLKGAFPKSILDAKEYAGEITVTLRRDDLVAICSFLKEEGFTYLVELFGIHYPEEEHPLHVHYLLHEMETQERIRLITSTTEDEPIPSVTGVWKTAGWLEREAWDMVGIRFEGHPDLRRILTWETFNGHPLRKDFPIEGIDTGAAIYPDTYPEGGGPKKKEPQGPKPAPKKEEN